MFYEKKIKYLDYLVSGEKKRGAGFVKTEVRDKEMRLHINVNGIYTAKPLETDIVLKGGRKETKIRKIRLNNGTGDSGEIRLNADHLGGGLSYGELEEIVIPLSEKCEIVCVWDVPKKAVDKPLEAETKAAGVKDAPADVDYAENEQNRQGTNRYRYGNENMIPVMENERAAGGNERAAGGNEGAAGESERGDGEIEEENIKKAAEEGDVENMTGAAESEEEDPVDGRSGRQDILGETMPSGGKTDETDAKAQGNVNPNRVEGYDRWEKAPFEDKWRQLAAIYPHMDFSAEISDCITIKPADFVILPQKYYSMVTNSFLLHGYHNYGHLVLARVEKRGEIKYYIGVPGVFFDKERQVALMFGFESFECGKDFAQTGDFGYYMIRVEL